MNQKKIKALRKRLGLKLPIKADLRVSKTVKKMVYSTDVLGVTTSKMVDRYTIINAAKSQYKQLKKIFKEMKNAKP